MTRIAIFLSGRGSNFVSLYEKIKNGYITCGGIALVFSNNPNAQGLLYAKENNLQTVCLPSKGITDRAVYDLEILNILQEHKIDLVCLAGYMRILTEPLVEAYAGKMMNIHPSLLPSFKGANAQRQAIDYGVKITGCTVHFVDSGVDTGPIIMQQPVPVFNDDTEETLSERILHEEHLLYPKAVKAFTEGRILYGNGKVHIKDEDK